MKYSRTSFVSRHRVAFFIFVALSLTFAAAVAHAQSDGQDGEETVPDAAPQVQAFYAGATLFKTALSEASSITFTGPADNAYQDLPGAGIDGGAIAVIAGQGTLVTARFTAESQCAGGGTDPGWCGVRILVNGGLAVTGGFCLR